jgi:O-succinylbenzoate synthase
MSFAVEEVVLHVVSLPAREPFVTSYGSIDRKTPIIIELRGNGIRGFAEAPIPPFPFYSHETTQSALYLLKEFAIPMFFKERPESPQALAKILKKIVGNPFARGGLEMAYWDFCAKQKNIPLYRLLGGKRNRIPAGVSIGIKKNLDELVDAVGAYLEKRYHRIKIKIAPGHERGPVERLFKEFPQIKLMVDANSAYSLDQAKVFKELDSYPLLMIEQPLHETDIYEHSLLQRELKNPICLDESIESVLDAEAALALGSCRVINIKPGRVGGLSEALAIHDAAQARGVPVWCGGMLESGVGRSINMALATLENFKFPGDISESKRYYHEDIVDPEIVLTADGYLELQEGPGIGFQVNEKQLAKLTLTKEVVR